MCLTLVFAIDSLDCPQSKDFWKIYSLPHLYRGLFGVPAESKKALSSIISWSLYARTSIGLKNFRVDITIDWEFHQGENCHRTFWMFSQSPVLFHVFSNLIPLPLLTAHLLP